GYRTGDIGHAVQTYAESFGLSVVRELEGHGLGKEMHEDPGVPNYGRPGHGAKLIDGMVICIEPMINLGTRGVYVARNGWAVHTADHKKSAHYELTVVIRKGRAEQLSTYDFIEKKQ
ncbi:MAG: M24 family metallopeptidase, partial [Bacteroidales bacterium]